MGKTPEFLIIPAAGYGLRMQTVDPEVPKEMLSVGEKPAIQYAVIEALSAGIEHIVIIINRRKEVIRRYVEDRTFRESHYPLAAREMDEAERRCSMHFLYQEEPKGEWDAVSLARSRVGNSSLAIFLPDNIYFPAPGAMTLLKESFERHKRDVIALTRVQKENAPGLGNSGKVDLSFMSDNVFRVERFYPKGRGSFVSRFPGELRCCGISVFGSHLFEYIERARGLVRAGEEFTDVSVRSLVLKEREILGCRLPGILFDVGNPTGYNLCLSHIRETPL